MRNFLYRTFLNTGFAALLLGAAGSFALAEGTLTHMSGPVSIRKSDSGVTPGVSGAKVTVGDTVVTGAGAYVRMEMTDTGEIVMRPNTELKIEAYQFDRTVPSSDNFFFSVLKGGLRTVTGLIGKRGNRDAYMVKTTTATIGIRGTQFDLRQCEGNCGAIANGTYVAVRYGAVEMRNPQGALIVAAGQFGHVPPLLPPVILPRNPGIGFSPPPAIPKLDESKKAPPPVAPAGTTPDPAKPPGSAPSQGQSTQTQQRSGAADSTTKDGSTQTGTSGTNSATDKPAAPAAPNSSGTSGAASSTGGGTSGTSAQDSRALTPPGIALTAPQSGPSPLTTPLSQPSSTALECSVQ